MDEMELSESRAIVVTSIVDQDIHVAKRLGRLLNASSISNIKLKCRDLDVRVSRLQLLLQIIQSILSTR